MNREQFQAIEMLKWEGVDLHCAYKFQDNPDPYDVVIMANDRGGTRYFFIIKSGELVYDGWDKEPCIPIDCNPN